MKIGEKYRKILTKNIIEILKGINGGNFQRKMCRNVYKKEDENIKRKNGGNFHRKKAENFNSKKMAKIETV